MGPWQTALRWFPYCHGPTLAPFDLWDSGEIFKLILQASLTYCHYYIGYVIHIEKTIDGICTSEIMITSLLTRNELDAVGKPASQRLLSLSTARGEANKLNRETSGI